MMRRPSKATGWKVCRQLKSTLRKLPNGVKRMVVGHTPQPGGIVTTACGGSVIRIDVGMSRGIFGAAPQVIEVSPKFKGGFRVISGSRPGAKIGALQTLG